MGRSEKVKGGGREEKEKGKYESSREVKRNKKDSRLAYTAAVSY